MVALVGAVLLLSGAAAHAAPTPSAGSLRPSLQTDLGTHHFPITTTSKRAQQFFDQGLRLTYAFSHAEAIRSFEEALRHDPNAVMAYWGVANALGPNIHAPMTPAQERQAVQALKKARAGAKNLSARERDYVAALSYRYSEEVGDHRAALDRTYADAMRVLSRKYPTDLDAATLFAEALMDLSPWDYWTREGRPQRYTAEIVATLERVLKTNPDHPGACHFYIHALEASSHPERALPCADRLPKLMPGAGHLAHVPAHIYMRVGRYAEAVERNLQGVRVDEASLRDRGKGGFYGAWDYLHNLHFLWAALVMEGRSREAGKAAADLAKVLPPARVTEVPALEFFCPTPLYGMVRFGRWEAILSEPEPPTHLRFMTGMWHYARGLAFARTNRLEQADEERRLLGVVVDATPDSYSVGHNSAKTLLDLAAHVLVAELAAVRGEDELAMREMEEAMAIEDALAYEESPAWHLPVRQSFGAVLLSVGRAAEAEQVYREDLVRHPNNGWSLFGLGLALTAQRRTEEAAAVERRFRTAWARADVALTASRF